MRPAAPDASAASGAGATGAVRLWLRVEGLVALFLGALLYAHLGDASWWLFALLFFAPDLAMIGYLAGPQAGARLYNLVHSYAGPLLLAIAALLLDWTAALPFALIWAAHIGFDRALGYGLKYPHAFHDTHLGPIGRRNGA